MTPLRVIQAVVVAVICLAFPVCSWLVFESGLDRTTVANGLAVVYAFGLYILFSTPLWPLGSLSTWSRAQRLEDVVFVWFWMTYITHLTWELGWLVLFDDIVASKDSAWAYIWWAYIDGGDLRYATLDHNLWTMEILSVVNGTIGMTGLWLWFRRPQQQQIAVLLFMATAVVHLYATSLYFGGEIFAGFPNVNTDSFFDVGIKFVLANSPWLVMPWLVLYWGSRQILQSDPT